MQLWFAYGDRVQIQEVLNEGLASVPTITWLKVIPQFVARIHVPNKIIQQSIYKLLSDVSYEHPQLVLTPLLVASRSEREQMVGSSQISGALTSGIEPLDEFEHQLTLTPHPLTGARDPMLIPEPKYRQRLPMGKWGGVLPAVVPLACLAQLGLRDQRLQTLP